MYDDRTCLVTILSIVIIFIVWIQEGMANQKKLLDWWNSWPLILRPVTLLDRFIVVVYFNTVSHTWLFQKELLVSSVAAIYWLRGMAHRWSDTVVLTNTLLQLIGHHLVWWVKSWFLSLSVSQLSSTYLSLFFTSLMLS